MWKFFTTLTTVTYKWLVYISIKKAFKQIQNRNTTLEKCRFELCTSTDSLQYSKSPIHEPSNCELPKMRTWVHMSSSHGWGLSRVHPLQVVVHLCTLVYCIEWVSLVAQMVRNLPPMQGTQVQSLGQKDPLEKGIGTHSSIFAWRIPWNENAGRLQSTGSQRVRHDWVTNTFTFHCIEYSSTASLFPAQDVQMWMV